MRFRFLQALLLAAILITSGCASLLSKPDRSDPEALLLLERVARHNHRLETFKGLGDLSLVTAATGPAAFRLAWMCSVPDRMRFELMAFSGNPFLSLATDGDRVYWLPHAENSDFHTFRQKHLNLEKLIGIPITTDEILLLLAGRVPVRPHNSVELVTGEAGRRELRLKNGWRGEVQRIRFSTKEALLPDEIIMFTDFGRQVSYRIVLEEIQQVNGFTIPHTVSFTAGTGDTASLKIRRYWTNVTIDDAIFVLTDKTAAKK